MQDRGFDSPSRSLRDVDRDFGQLQAFAAAGAASPGGNGFPNRDVDKDLVIKPDDGLNDWNDFKGKFDVSANRNGGKPVDEQVNKVSRSLPDVSNIVGNFGKDDTQNDLRDFCL